MSKPPTISLPFTSFDDIQTKPKWYNILAGSRLRNRALSIGASLLGFVLFLLLLRRMVSGSHYPQTSSSTVAPGSSPSLHVYDGDDIETFHATLDHLIIVAGHAIWLGGASYSNDADWILEPHQTGQMGTFIEHIRKGASLALEDPNSLLVFSGGETRHAAGARSESQSYTALFQLLETERPILGSIERVTTEEFARDSYENLIYSVARFYEVTGRYPNKISIVGFMFKKERFTEIHRKAIRFPAERFSYHGIDPPGLKGEDLSGESTNARTLFEADLYGCRDKVLLEKKKGRNPGRRRHGYELSNPAIADLLDFCPPDGSSVYEGSLPWSPPSPA